MTVQSGIVRRGIGRRIVGGLVDDQVADRARLRVEDIAAGLRVGGRRSRRTRRDRRNLPASPSALRNSRVTRRGKVVVGRAELGLVDAAQIEQIVLAAVDRAQTVGETDVRDQVRAAACRRHAPRRS